MAREKRIKHEWQESSLDFCSVEGWSAEQQALEYARTALGSMGYAKCTIDGKPAEIFGLMIKYRTTLHTEEMNRKLQTGQELLKKPFRKTGRTSLSFVSVFMAIKKKGMLSRMLFILHNMYFRMYLWYNSCKEKFVRVDHMYG